MFSLNLPNITPSISTVFIAQAGLIAGLAGSVHCVGMCGGLVMSVAKSPKDHIYYQIGRLLGYLILAMLVGFSAQAVENYFSPLLQEIFGLTLGFFLIFTGIKAYKKISFHLPFTFSNYLSKLSSLLPKSSFFVGLSSFLLPCGLLYSVLTSLLLVKDPLKAMIAITLFWMGSAPMLMLLPGTLKKCLEKVGIVPSHVFGLMFIIMGLVNIGSKLFPIIFLRSNHLNCH